MKAVFLFLSLILFSLINAQPAPPGGPYEHNLDLSSELSNIDTSIPRYFGAPAYYRVYWSVTSTHVIFGIVCRISYPPGFDTSLTFEPNKNIWCGFGFTDNPGFMFATSSDAVIAHIDNGNVVVEDFRLAGRRAQASACAESVGPLQQGACRDVDYTWNQPPACVDNVLTASGVVTNITAEEVYLAFTFSRLLNTNDRATCDRAITLGVPVNPIFSIGFAYKALPWPYNIGSAGAGTFVHAARGPIDPALSITFQLTTTTAESTTAEQTTAEQTTQLVETTEVQTTDLDTTEAQTTESQTTVLQTTSRITTASITTGRSGVSSSSVLSVDKIVVFASLLLALLY